MRKYKAFPYTNGLCLACCLQSVLDRRGFSVPRQEEIAGYFQPKGQGLIVGGEELNQFLKSYNLQAIHRLPVEIEEPDSILRNAFNTNTDILVAYSFTHLFKTQKPALHVSLLADFNEGIEKEVLLFDSGFKESFLKRVSLQDLVQSMISTESANSGFYLINHLSKEGSGSMSQDFGQVSHSAR